MNLVTAKQEQAFIDRIKQLDTAFVADWKIRHKGVPLGFSNPDAQLFRAMFEKLANENPNWVLALRHCEGGQQEVRRYMQVTGMTGEGLDWREFAVRFAVRVVVAKAQRAMVDRMKAQATPNATPVTTAQPMNPTPLAGGGFPPPAPPTVPPLPAPNTMSPNAAGVM